MLEKRMLLWTVGAPSFPTSINVPSLFFQTRQTLKFIFLNIPYHNPKYIRVEISGKLVIILIFFWSEHSSIENFDKVKIT